MLAKNIADNAISIEDYLQGEPNSPIKYEYIDGQVMAMAGASLKHNLITTNILGLLWGALRKSDCFPLSSDMLVKTSENSFRYPDVVVICDQNTADNHFVHESPVLIIEVLSKSTRKKDKTEKRDEYLAIPSLQEYILIEQDFVEIDVQCRRDHWQSSYYFLGDEIHLKSIDVTVAVEDIYQRIDHPEIRNFIKEKQ